MKKFLSMLLALVMVLSLGTVAFAAEPTGSKDFTTVVDDSENEASFDVTATADVKTGANYADIVYSVKVEWTVDTANINIDKGGLYVWDPEDLMYKLQAGTNAFALDPEGNSSVDVEIKFTNKSNADVAYDIAYADNATDKLTTSEDLTAAATVAKTGKVNSADTQEGVSTTENTEGTGHDYIIDDEATNLNTAGTAGEVTYNGTVTVTKVEDGANFEGEGAKNLTLGTYTVTLGKVVPCKTVADLFATIATEDFPNTDEKLWSSGGNSRLAIQADNMLIAMTSPWLEDYVLGTTVVTPVGKNYTCTSVYGGATVTFIMTNGKLTAIKVSNEPTEVMVGQDTVDLTPLNGTYTKTT